MEDEIANLRFTDEEEDVFREDPKASDYDIQFCLVGTYLTDNVFHFPSPRNTMVDLWHPIGEIAITNLGLQRYIRIRMEFRPSGIGDNVTRLMDLGSDKESSLIHIDERKTSKDFGKYDDSPRSFNYVM
ncbi:hypothetical protein GOBAR_AA10461 [Gossypium barbadense]|uniref:DUF4283 domain-containing protein n=1 Tax=Gossypium barbadense TaxID=3634 RepID=A0A2P5Y3R7_GOSBA|nr:hypothetical protein GOBAR_AA10461 [Gossypium barbadense]